MEDKKVDLNRMKQLLDGLNGDVPSSIDLNNEKTNFKEEEEYIKDIRKGKIVGYSNTVFLKYLYSDIITNINFADDMQSISFEYFCNPKTSIFAICEVMEKIHDDKIIDENTEILFNVVTLDNMSPNKIKYRILSTKHD